MTVQFYLKVGWNWAKWQVIIYQITKSLSRFRVNTSKRKIRVSTTVPAARMEAHRIHCLIKKSKAVDTSPISQTLSIPAVGTIAPVSMQATKVASIKTGVREHREIRRLQSFWWRFVDVDYFVPINVQTQPFGLRFKWRLL